MKFRKWYLPRGRERIGAVAADKAEKEGRAMGWQKALVYAFAPADEGFARGE